MELHFTLLLPHSPPSNQTHWPAPPPHTRFVPSSGTRSYQSLCLNSPPSHTLTSLPAASHTLGGSVWGAALRAAFPDPPAAVSPTPSTHNQPLACVFIISLFVLKDM